jgi:hypothetical protein
MEWCTAFNFVNGKGLTVTRVSTTIPALLIVGTSSLATVSCSREPPPCEKCGTVVIAAVVEPTALLPPLVTETVGRDIGDQVFERLAELAPGAAPIDSTAYQPRLASRWERLDSVT